MSWHDRRVYDSETGLYLGRAVGEPYTDGVEGLIALRQDEAGQTIKPVALCAFVVLDSDPFADLQRLADQAQYILGVLASGSEPWAPTGYGYEHMGDYTRDVRPLCEGLVALAARVKRAKERVL